MTMPARQPRLERDVVLAALRAQDVIDRYQLRGRTTGDEFRTGLCPTCGPRTRADAVAINLVTGKWSDHAHGCAGDLLDLVAGLAALDTRRDFERVLELAADIAGVGPGADPADVERHRQRMRLAQELQAADKAKRQAAAKVRARIWWADLHRSSGPGGRYLTEQRGLDVQQLIDRDLVRFGAAGDVYVALWSSTGTVVNVVKRVLEPGDGPKVLGLKDAPALGTLVGHLQQLRVGTTAVVTEGVIDSLTAALAWPDAVILGAHGAGNFATIVAYASRYLHERNGRLLLPAHHDRAGQDALDAAMHRALEAGMVVAGADGEPDCRVHVVDFGAEHKDLNDAWRAGWRP
jgi:hypothetical protein